MVTGAPPPRRRRRPRTRTLPRSTVAWCAMSATAATGVFEPVRPGEPQAGPRVRDGLDRAPGSGERRIVPLPAAAAQQFTVQRGLGLHAPAERVQFAQRAGVSRPGTAQGAPRRTRRIRLRPVRAEVTVAKASSVGAQEAAEQFGGQRCRRSVETNIEAASADLRIAEERVLDIGRIRRTPAAARTPRSGRLRGTRAASRPRRTPPRGSRPDRRPPRDARRARRRRRAGTADRSCPRRR